ncbi:MAG TPA: phosphonate C-P lyase system protein PhnG [Paracoccus sp. (in: a-proteobacteria)]|uniref:phosphonate C-P lyase system protein PhnG n=1 Tax=Paracoccus sp. TaxID=267 RepID=UPI002C62C1E9|nr:phosphonate C-P lyase system protein PhnG [Paracoccus sp. (in: a-proteobacteria)]HWL55219.1 phosphonate C-P lyase system protein PhnG [Paracoccus sp. (in: a-proteobacteria)]
MFDQNAPPAKGGPMAHGQNLQVLARAPAERLKPLAESLLPHLGAPEVLQSRTGLVLLPMRDTVEDTDFHLGEVLVSEAHLRHGGHQGYGMIVGRDLERAMAMAVIDLALDAGIEAQAIAAFLLVETMAQAAEDRATLCAVEATRVEMETF